MLAERVVADVAPSTWAGHGGNGTIEYRADDRTLLVEQSPAAQRQILDFLRTLRRRRDTAVVLETLAVSVSKETAERLGVVFDPAEGGVIDQDQFIRVRRFLYPEAQGSILSAPTVSCWTGQTIDVRLDQQGIDAEFGLAPTVSADRRTIRPNLRLWDDRFGGGKRFEAAIPQGSTLVLPGRAVTRKLSIPASIPDGPRLFNELRKERADCVLVFLTLRVLPRTDAERAKKDTVRDRVLENLDEGGSASHDRREAAYQRLWEIGRPALGFVSSMARFDRERRWEIASRFCRGMQEEHGVVPVRGDGIEVQPVVALVWDGPSAGCKTPVRLALKVTNVGPKPISFYRVGPITPFITTGDGVWQALRGLNRDSVIVPAEPFASLEPGRAFTHDAGTVELHAAEDGKNFSVTIYDATGGWGGVSGLKRGRNYVSFAVECSGSFKQSWWAGVKKDPHPVWFGEVYSALVCIEIR